MRPRPRARAGDDGVAGVVAAILMVSAVVALLAVVRLSWAPVWAEDAEARHSEDLRAAFVAWADAAEDHVARGLENRTFVRTLPLGAAAQTIPLVGGVGGATGSVSVEAGPTLTVSLGGSTKATASGALAAATLPTRHPPQTFRYALGALEVNQTDASWVDLRSLLTVSRASGGQVRLTVQAVTLGGGTQAAGSAGDAAVAATVDDVASATHAAGTVRVQAEGVAGDAWRAAAKRAVNAAGLGWESRAECATASQKACFDSDTNDADSFDLYVRDVASGWTTVTGTLTVEARA